MARKDQVTIRVTYEHQLNFGTAEKPNYKTNGDIVQVEKEVADRLVAQGYAEHEKGEGVNAD